MRILLVEDEEDLAYVIKKGLEEERYSVDTCYNGEDGLFMAEEVAYDAIILDIMLPRVDGITVLRTLRTKGVATPVLMLTAKDLTEDKIRGLDTGADDYLTKPFDFGELLARLRALLRRTTPMKSALLEIGGLVLDTAKKEVTRDGNIISLTAKEYAILEYMAYNHDTVLSRTKIIEHVYDDSFDLYSNVIDVHINSLRNKIDKGCTDKLISTVRGAGYILRKQ